MPKEQSSETSVDFCMSQWALAKSHLPLTVLICKYVEVWPRHIDEDN